jgi:hypothetical protein
LAVRLAGEICGTQVTDDSIVETAIKFEHTHIKDVKVNLNQVESSYQAGEFLAKALPLTLQSLMSGGEEKLKHVLILSDGSKVNRSDLQNQTMTITTLLEE